MPEFEEQVSNIAEYSVSEISGSIKRTMEDTYGRIRVRGELGRVSRPASGHIYLDLKDDRAVLAAVIWKGAVSKMAIKPEEGLEVIATGKITTFPGQSKYQLIIDAIEPAGEGALMALLAERRRKLEAEGLFDPARKQLLPFMPKTIGVVTSPTGAVIRDIIHRLSDRFPCHVLVWPVRVQGETSAQEIAAAIDGFNALDDTSSVAKPDLLIVARGGGSLEDLWSFNEEIVVRATANSDLPIISAVGHETDTTLIDFSADVRAPTPTGAAEMAVPVKADLVARVAQIAARLQSGLTRSVDRKREFLRGLARALPQPDGLLALPRQRLDANQLRLVRSLDGYTAQKRNQLTTARARLNPAQLVQRFVALQQSHQRLQQALPASLGRGLQLRRRELSFRAERLSPQTVHRSITAGRERTDALGRRQNIALQSCVSSKRAVLNQASKLLGSLSYERVLDRGFALVRDAQDNPLRSSRGVAAGDGLTIQFGADDRLSAIAAGSGEDPKSRGGQKVKKTRRKPDSGKSATDQGTLF